MNLVQIWCDDRYWSKILRDTIPTLLYSLKVKATDLECLGYGFMLKFLRTSLFPNPVMDLVHVWYDDRYWSKILLGTIPTLVVYLKVKVTNLEILY